MLPRATRPLAYLWAFPNTLVGLLVASPALLGFGGATCVDGVLEVHGGWATPLLRYGAGLFLPGGAAAMTLGHVVLGLDPATLARTRAHERVHVRQFERWGPFFLPTYALASLAAAGRGQHFYRDNCFERQAYEQDA